MKSKSTMYRQGDVLVERVGSLPSKVKKAAKRRVILAHGEVTGHAHAIADVPVSAETHKDGSLVFRPEQAQGAPIQVSAMEIQSALAALKHDEHATIPLEAGQYRVTRQREYSPEAVRNVAD